MLADENQDKYIYLSIGNRISLSTATQIVLKLLVEDSPLPIKAIDGLTRKMIRKMGEHDYNQA
jgi:deoxyinosine 3'endonuclease (endonuclease V)